MNVCLSRKLLYRELEKYKLLVNYAGTVNYDFCRMCVRKVDGWARTQAAHHCREQLLSDALFGVGVRVMDDLSTDSTSQTGTVFSQTIHMVCSGLIHQL